MIILVNGSFGVGKTTTAHMLSQRINDSVVFDPEEVGFMVGKITRGIRFGVEDTDDFQDIEIWKVLVVETARELKKQYGKNLVIPMTIYKERNYKYIVEGLKEIDTDFYHFCLTASYDTIQSRLRERGDVIDGWSFRKAEECVKVFEDDVFKKHIYTDELNANEVVKIILREINGGKR